MIQFFHATYIHLDIQPKAPELFNCCILSPELVLWMFPPIHETFFFFCNHQAPILRRAEGSWGTVPLFFSLPKTTCFVGNLCIYVFFFTVIFGAFQGDHFDDLRIFSS